MTVHAHETSELDQAVAAWQAGTESGEFTEAVLEWAGSLAGYARRTRPYLSGSEDLEADALEWVLAQMRAWRPGEGNVRGFLASRFDWFCSDVARQQFDMPTKGWQRVGAIAAELRSEFTAAGLPCGFDELREGCRARLENELERAVRSAHPRWGAARVSAEVAARLRKDGLANALDRFADVLTAFAPALRLDAPVRDDDGLTFGQSLPADDRDRVQEERRMDELTRVMLGDAEWARQALSSRVGCDVEGGVTGLSLQALARECGHSVEELKAVLRLATSRAAAPHAQWAHLADLGLFQFSEPGSVFADA